MKKKPSLLIFLTRAFFIPCLEHWRLGWVWAYQASALLESSAILKESFQEFDSLHTLENANDMILKVLSSEIDMAEIRFVIKEWGAKVFYVRGMTKKIVNGEMIVREFEVICLTLT